MSRNFMDVKGAMSKNGAYFAGASFIGAGLALGLIQVAVQLALNTVLFFSRLFKENQAYAFMTSGIVLGALVFIQNSPLFSDPYFVMAYLFTMQTYLVLNFKLEKVQSIMGASKAGYASAWFYVPLFMTALGWGNEWVMSNWAPEAVSAAFAPYNAAVYMLLTALLLRVAFRASYMEHETEVATRLCKKDGIVVNSANIKRMKVVMRHGHYMLEKGRDVSPLRERHAYKSAKYEIAVALIVSPLFIYLMAF